MFNAQAKQAALADVIAELRIREAQLEASLVKEVKRSERAEAEVAQLRGNPEPSGR